MIFCKNNKNKSIQTGDVVKLNSSPGVIYEENVGIIPNDHIRKNNDILLVLSIKDHNNASDQWVIRLLDPKHKRYYQTWKLSYLYKIAEGKLF